MTNHQIERIHATAVAWRGSAVLLLGPTGSGKSSIALQMMAHGCGLVADDQSILTQSAEGVIVTCPEAIKGQIEARNFGILQCNYVAQAKLVCVVDLATVERKRLPIERSMTICGRSIRLFHNSGIEGLPFALLQYLKSCKSA